MELRYKNFAIIYNSGKDGAQAIAESLMEILKKLGARAQIYQNIPATLSGHDIISTIGGDGTLLKCVPAALTGQIPVVGVNIGKLGYLTSIDKSSLQESLPKIAYGEFTATPRMVLKAVFPDGSTQYALNDIVIKSAEYRLAELKLLADGQFATQYDCDGLIFSTPTGSTAYNLSAGGPLVHFKTDAIVVTPICAHSLTNRSLVFNSRSTLRVEPGDKPRAIHVNVDGRPVAESRDCLPIQIRQATRKLMILEDSSRTPFDTLREKLGWK